MSDEHPAPAHVLELAEACVRFVASATDMQLDYTQDTLPILDHYADLVPKDEREELIALVAPAMGAYFGEVVRRYFGDGRWHAPVVNYDGWRMELDRCFLHFNPVSVALEVVLSESFEGGQFELLDEDREDVRNALERDGEVEEETFFRFTTRFEVLERIYSVLITRAQLRGETHRRFSADVYRAAVPQKPDDSKPSQ